MNPDTGLCLRCIIGRPKAPAAPVVPVQRRGAGLVTARQAVAEVLPQLAGVPEPVENPLTLARLGTPAFAVVVAGFPAPQGSKRPVGGGKMVEQLGKSIQAWRRAVVDASRRVLPPDWEPLTGPIVADLTFTRHRPKCRPFDVWHETSPDIDKLVRSTFDALSPRPGWIGVWKDDRLAVGFRSLAAVYAGSDWPDALPHPGAVIRLWPAPC